MADTIALVEQVHKSREIPTGIAIAVIAVLSLLAGVGGYLMRSTSAAAAPQLDPTAQVTNVAPHQGNR